MINFTSYKNETIDFTKFSSPALICGDNGNGKSSIVDAITTALYCQARCSDSRGTGIDELINKNEKSFTIDFSFQIDNHTYRVLRTKVKNGSHKLNFWIDNNDQPSSIKETQQKILDILKINYDTFLDTVCITQNKASLFMEKSPIQRKEIFAQILNLENYSELEKLAKDLRKKLVSDINIKTAELNSIQTKIQYEDEYKEKLKIYQSDINNIKIDSLQLELNNLQINKSRIDAIKSKNELILSQRNKLKKSIERYSNFINEQQKELDNLFIEDILPLEKEKDLINLDNLTDEIQKLMLTNSEYNVQIKLYKQQLNELKNKINNIQNCKNEQCEFCGNNITEEYKENYINQLKNTGNNIVIKVQEIKNKSNIIDNQIQDKQNQYHQLKKQFDNLSSKINNIKININKQENLKINIQNNIIELNQFKKEYEDNLKEEIIEIEDIDLNRIYYLENEINKLIDKKNQYTEKIAILKDRLQQIKEFKKNAKILNKELKDLNLKSEDYKSLINAFSKSGI